MIILHFQFEITNVVLALVLGHVLASLVKTTLYYYYVQP